MKILVIGAGAVGGYFGGRLLEAGRDVTFCTRARRAAELAATGLVIESPFGNARIAAPPTVVAEALRAPFDLVLLSCKAYDLAAAARSFAPAVGAGTTILPLQNGMRHLAELAQSFGPERIVGGTALISSTLDAGGRILHLNGTHELRFGELSGGRSERVAAIAAEFAPARFEARPRDAILADMWEKWVLIASTAAATCLLRGTVGDIVAADATVHAFALLDECAAIAGAANFPPSPSTRTLIRALLSAPGSALTASMLRDVERSGPTEADYILGDLIARGAACGAPPAPLLQLAYAHLRTYAARRSRETRA